MYTQKVMYHIVSCICVAFELDEIQTCGRVKIFMIIIIYSVFTEKQIVEKHDRRYDGNMLKGEMVTCAMVEYSRIFK